MRNKQINYEIRKDDKNRCKHVNRLAATENKKI